MSSLTVLALALASLASLAAAPALAQQPPTIAVSATGQASAPPDMALLQLGVRREGETAEAALNATSEVMDEVMAAMRAFGIAERDLRTADLSIQPLYAQAPPEPVPGRPPTITGYAVTNTLSVRVRDLVKAGEVLDRAVSLGVNAGGDIDFTNAEPAPLLEQARRDAVRQATARAKVLAEEAGVALGTLRSMREGDTGDEPPYGRPTLRLSRSVPIAGGENEYSVTVTMEWEIAR